MHKLKLAGLSILSGVLMGLSWPATGNLAPLFFVALLPLLYVEYTIFQNPDKYGSRHVFYNAYLAFFTFNTFTTWWIAYASSGGMAMAEVLNSLFMAIIFLWFHGIKKRMGIGRGYFSLIVLWIGFEWLHYHWELSHPWSSFGNTFANYPQLVQWYEYTGVLGGSFWILLVNLLFFHLFKHLFILGTGITKNMKLIVGILLLLIIPSTLSFITYYQYEEVVDPVEVVVVQPNIDPYSDKFENMSEAEQIDRIINLAKKEITPTTDYIVTPETALPNGSTESRLEQNYGIQQIRKLISEYPRLKFVVGMSSYVDYPKTKQKPTPSARPDRRREGAWYDAFNTALQLNKTDSIQIYHKSKLVLGVEKMPFATILSPLEGLAIDMGGSMGSLGTQEEALTFKGSRQVAPIICYESIYGEYFSEYIKKGANLAFVITNDGWWEDTPGYKQHLSYARLRAIETRRSIARSANTGISCFINQRGDIIKATNWWEQDVITHQINSNSIQTYYTKNGDLIGRISAFIAVLLLIWSWVLLFKKSD